MKIKEMISLAITALLAACLPVWASGAVSEVTPDEALKTLKDGNERFVSGAMKNPNKDQARRTLTASGGQHPYATILGCSDSRAPAEVLFDCGIGDIFVVRVAGNVADVDEIGTMEYGAGHLAVPLIVVLGHTQCGAVTAVMTDAHVGGSIPGLVSKITPVAQRIKKAGLRLPTEELVAMAIKENVWQGIENVLSRSEEIRHLVSAGKTKIIGALYDLETGKIAWMGEHPSQTELLSGAHAEEGPAAAHAKPAQKAPASKPAAKPVAKYGEEHSAPKKYGH